MAGGGTGGRKGRIRQIKPLKLDDVRNEINVTPLVDVCLVLLIIFMVVTPMLARGKEVPLPKTANHEEEADKNQPIVALDSEGRVYFDKEVIATVGPDDKLDSTSTLSERLEAAWAADEASTGRVFVKADRDLPYVKVYPLIIGLHELGIQAIDLGTNEIKDNEPAAE
ncbi:MAG: biopolymer transporter ExbD [Myxococcota bacterium]